MRNRKTLLLLPLFLLAACSDSPTGSSGFRYLDYTTPDNLVQNLLDSWLRMDFDEYRHMLYDGEMATTEDGEWPPFQMRSFSAPVWEYHAELDCCERLMNGRPGDGGRTPPVIEVDMEFFGFTTGWMPRSSYGGQPAPDGTLMRFYQTFGVFTHQWNFEGTEYSSSHINDELTIVVIPVLVGSEIEYRLWRWTDWGNVSDRPPHTNWVDLKASFTR